MFLSVGNDIFQRREARAVEIVFGLFVIARKAARFFDFNLKFRARAVDDVNRIYPIRRQNG